MNARCVSLLLLTLLALKPAWAQSLSSLFSAERVVSGLDQTVSSSVASGAVLIGLGNVAYHSVNLEVDTHGGMHAAYVHYAGGDTSATPVYYAYCAPADLAACDDPATWQRVPIGTNETFVQLELTPEDQPRVMMHHETLATPWGGGNTWYRYAECNDTCTSATSWTIIDLLTNQNGGAFNSADYVAHSFQLDPEGRPRLIHQQALGAVASYYVGCDEEDCTDPANWWEVRLPTDSFGDGLKRSVLAFTPAGEPRILTTVFTGTTTEQLFYLACTEPCMQPTDWTVSEPLLTMGGDGHRSWTLQLDQAGRPRFALTMAGTTAYAWCNAGCDQEANWSAYPPELGSSPIRYPTLVLDAQDRPRLAYQDQGPGGLGYAWCERDCENATQSSWWYMLTEDDDVLDEELPVLPLSGCQQGAWLSGYRPSLALDPAGNPRFGHDGEHLMPCYHDPQHPEQGTFVEPKWWTSRVVFFPQPEDAGTPNEDEPAVPAEFGLEQNYPNPFNPTTTIPFTLQATTRVQLVIYDLTGRELAVVVDGVLPAGTHRVAWDARGVPSGVYLVRLTADGAIQVRPLTVLK